MAIVLGIHQISSGDNTHQRVIKETRVIVERTYPPSGFKLESLRLSIDCPDQLDDNGESPIFFSAQLTYRQESSLIFSLISLRWIK